MERRYISPEMDIIEFDTNDVITTSSGVGGEAGSSEVINVNGITMFNKCERPKIRQTSRIVDLLYGCITWFERQKNVYYYLSVWNGL